MHTTDSKTSQTKHVLKCFADWQICLQSEVIRSLFLLEAFAVKTVLLSLLHFYGKIKKFAGIWKRNLALWPGMAANSVTSCRSRYQESKFGFAGLNFTVCWSWGIWEPSASSDCTGLVNAMWARWVSLFPLPYASTGCLEEPWGFRGTPELKEGVLPCTRQLSAPGLLPSPASGTHGSDKAFIPKRSAKIWSERFVYRPALFFHLEFSLYSSV